MPAPATHSHDFQAMLARASSAAARMSYHTDANVKITIRQDECPADIWPEFERFGDVEPEDVLCWPAAILILGDLPIDLSFSWHGDFYVTGAGSEPGGEYPFSREAAAWLCFRVESECESQIEQIIEDFFHDDRHLDMDYGDE